MIYQQNHSDQLSRIVACLQAPGHMKVLDRETYEVADEAAYDQVHEINELDFSNASVLN